MMWGTGEGMGWWMVIGSFWFVFFWAIVIWAVVRLAPRSEQREQTSAQEIVRQRYARGELNRDEYDQIRKDLSA